jgi:hypothetical protein
VRFVIDFSLNRESDKAYDISHSPAGELQIRIREQYHQNILEADEIIIMCRLHENMHATIIGLLQLSDALRGIKPQASQVLMTPYLPYSHAIKRFSNGDSHGLCTFSNLLNTAQFSAVIALDAYNPQVAGNWIMNFHNVKPDSILMQSIDHFAQETDRIDILFQDEMTARRYKLFPRSAAGLRIKQHFVIDRFNDAGELTGFDIPDRSKFHSDHLLMITNQCIGGSVFVFDAIGAAIQKQFGDEMLNIGLYATHGIFPEGLHALEDFDTIYTTDSFQQSKPKLYDPDLRVYRAFETMLTNPRQFYGPDRRAL